MLWLNHGEENLLFKAQDIYNVWQKIRKENLERLLLVQVILKKLTIGDK